MSSLALAPMAMDRVSGEQTLDDVVVAVWRGLSAGRAVACPVCHGRMEASREHTAPQASRCADCGARLR